MHVWLVITLALVLVGYIILAINLAGWRLILSSLFSLVFTLFWLLGLVIT